MLELPPPSDSKGDDDNDAGDDGEGRERLRKKFHRLALLSFHVHENGLEEEGVAHEGDRADEQGEHCHRCQDSVRLLSDERRAVGDEEDDEDDIQPCKKRIEIRVPSHTLTISDSSSTMGAAGPTTRPPHSACKLRECLLDTDTPRLRFLA
jgi:hypothetical protein